MRVTMRRCAIASGMGKRRWQLWPLRQRVCPYKSLTCTQRGAAVVETPLGCLVGWCAKLIG